MDGLSTNNKEIAKKERKEVLDKYKTANMYSDAVRERITSEIRDKLKEIVIYTPNDMELGGKIREMYFEKNKKNTSQEKDNS